MVACICNQVFQEGSLSNDSSSGPMQRSSFYNIGVHSKLSVNMVLEKESSMTKFGNEECIGSGWKHNRQKFSHFAIEG